MARYCHGLSSAKFYLFSLFFFFSFTWEFGLQSGDVPPYLICDDPPPTFSFPHFHCGFSRQSINPKRLSNWTCVSEMSVLPYYKKNIKIISFTQSEKKRHTNHLTQKIYPKKNILYHSPSTLFPVSHSWVWHSGPNCPEGAYSWMWTGLWCGRTLGSCKG